MTGATHYLAVCSAEHACSACSACSAVHAVQCSAVQCGSVQCSAVKCSAVQCSVLEYSAVTVSPHSADCMSHTPASRGIGGQWQGNCLPYCGVT